MAIELSWSMREGFLSFFSLAVRCSTLQAARSVKTLQNLARSLPFCGWSRLSNGSPLAVGLTPRRRTTRGQEIHSSDLTFDAIPQGRVSLDSRHPGFSWKPQYDWLFSVTIDGDWSAFYFPRFPRKHYRQGRTSDLPSLYRPSEPVR